MRGDFVQPPALVRRLDGLEARPDELVYRCVAVPSEALVVSAERGSIGFSLILGGEWQTEEIFLSAEQLEHLRFMLGFVELQG